MILWGVRWYVASPISYRRCAVAILFEKRKEEEPWQYKALVTTLLEGKSGTL
jgi:hypothetical protein